MTDTEPRYVLLTECLQNDFFLNRSCRLSLPDQVVKGMLLGKRQYDRNLGSGGHRVIAERALAEGPLGLLLDATVGVRSRPGERDPGTLHVINVRDWHKPNDSYDSERRSYGPHCEAGSWGARYIDGLAHLLDPAGAAADPQDEARYFEQGSVRVYHVHADSLFDFRPRSERIRRGEGKFDPSELEDILDVLVQGSEDDLAELQRILARDPHLSAIAELGRRVDKAAHGRNTARVYACVIGVYTDLKIKTLLTGLTTRYNLTNLAVSDTFTASTTLERHLAGLDYAKKVLNTEVIHGLNDVVRFLGGTTVIPNESEVIVGESYSRYASFFLDQQNVLAYQSERLQDYLLFTERRALRVYQTIALSNRFLLAWGGVFLCLTLVLSVLAAFGVVEWQLPAVSGGLSLAQFVGVFFRTSANDLQRNLTNLAIFKMILESHSLKTAFARYHLTTPQTLRELQTKDEADAAAQQIEALRLQLEVIAGYDRADFDDLAKLGFRIDATATPPAPEKASNGAKAAKPSASREPAR